MKNPIFSILCGAVLCLAAALPGYVRSMGPEPLRRAGRDIRRTVVRLDRVTDRRVSDRLLGFNVVYAGNPDSLWHSGVLAAAIRDVRPGFLRYPGGTVSTYFHWEHPTGNGWTDAWDPQYDPAQNRPPEEFMDIDEYLALVRATGAEPLVGININSGFRWNRIEEGIQEALRLMRYCRDRGVRVRYWFLGNEPFMSGCNGGAQTPAAYGEMINAFAPRMKVFDPDIRIVANWHATFRKHGRQYDELFAVAGSNIDVVDVHWYCMWGTASWDQWLARTPCGVFSGDSYVSEIERFREIAARNGVPHVRLASLEWNVGPGKKSGAPRLTAAQIALIQAEMMIQFMQGGLDMAAFWPLFWENEFSARGFFDKKTGELRPASAILKKFGTFQGASVVGCRLTPVPEKMLCLAVWDATTGRIQLCVLNKQDCVAEIAVEGPLADPGARIRTEGFRLSADGLSLEHTAAQPGKAGRMRLAPFSLTFITIF